MPQLIEKHIINAPIWSILLVNGKEGIFSLGGTSAAVVREVEQETADDLARIGHQNHKRAYIMETPDNRKPSGESNQWKWVQVQGAEGWWQIPLRAIWVDGIKILDSQPVILDVSIFQALQMCE
jgi:hypothetical protein